MNKIIITRYGGVGDIHMLEPVLQAIYTKHAPCEITFRTYKDYREVWINHPLVKHVLLDSMRYVTGYEPEGFDYHYNFQGVIEKNDCKTHGVLAFAEHFGLDIKTIIPNIYYQPQPIIPSDVVVQLKSAEAVRDLSRYKTLFDSFEIIGDTRISNDLFCSKINGCKLFFGTDSSGLHIAAGLNKKVIAVYHDYKHLKSRQYPGFDSFINFYDAFNHLFK